MGSLRPHQGLWETRHGDKLPEFSTACGRGLYLNLDLAQRGVGTATCGPDTLDQGCSLFFLRGLTLV